MQTLRIAVALLFIGLTACNNAGKQNNASSQDTMDHPDQTVSAEEIPPLPQVPADAQVYFKNLKDGETVSSPVKIEMAAVGIQVEPAGEIKEGFGHHHILIDAGDSMAAGTVIPADSNHIHFGKGQTEAELDLKPGTHKLTLQFADGIHRSYGGQLAKSITVKVK